MILLMLLKGKYPITVIIRWGLGFLIILSLGSLTLYMAWNHTNNHLLKNYREQVYGTASPRVADNSRPTRRD